jgi:hypothetical protein
MTGQPQSLAIYDSMVAAIDRCYRVDEVKDLRDKAMAFETYAKQAQNVEAERKAIEVRIRAERRAGELLKEMERSPVSKGGDLKSESAVQREHPISEFQKAKSDANISDTQAHRWQKLAEMPREDFEGKLQDPLVRPTTAGILNGNQPRQAPDDALWLWGRLRDFEREGYFQTNVNAVVGQMSQALQSDVRRIVPQLMDWFGELEY